MPKAKKIFIKLYDQYIDKIYRFIFLKVNSQEKAQDLTSETFLKFWKRLESTNLPLEIENPRAFLYQIARNLVIDHYREKGRVQLISTENVILNDPNIDLEKDAFLISELKQVQKALVDLKEEDQDVIIWYYLDELSVSEIAEILDKSENAIRLMVHRGLKNLRDRLNK